MVNQSHRKDGTHLLPIAVLLILGFCASLALSQELHDDIHIVGDPVFYNIDVPQVRQRRQTSNVTTNSSSTSSAPIPEVKPTTPSSQTDVPTELPTTNAVTETKNGSTSTVKPGTTKPGTVKPVTTSKPVNGTTLPAGTVGPTPKHWGDHNDTITDDHDYYNVTYVPPDLASEYFVDVDLMVAQVPAELTQKRVQNLGPTTRRAKQVDLPFVFEFYGHDIMKALVTTGGFIYVGTYIHRFLAATQYIAPLMANFDPSATPDATITSVANDSQFTVEWKNIKLGDMKKDNSTDSPVGKFTFQTTLYKDGRIVFAYKQIPVSIESINATSHPVRSGLADAYYNDTLITPRYVPFPLLWKRSIYEYHKVPLNFSKIVSNAAIVMEPKPTCHDLDVDGCHYCVSANIGFECAWCPKAKRCSSGFDRRRQSWQIYGCEVSNITLEDDCNRIPAVDDTPTKSPYKPTGKPPKEAPDCSYDDACNRHGQCLTDAFGNSFCKCRYLWIGQQCNVWKPDEDEDIEYEPHTPNNNPESHKAKGKSSSMGFGAIIFVILLIIIVTVLLGWVVYAYRRPTSNSGMFLIELRSMARQNRGDSRRMLRYERYEAAEDEQMIVGI